MCQYCNPMYKDNWRPDYIVGITRGGNVPATIISNMTGISEALKVSLRDDNRDSESMSGWPMMHSELIRSLGNNKHGVTEPDGHPTPKRIFP